MHLTKKAKFVKKFERLSGITKTVTWDMATKMVQMCSRVHSAQGKISILESLFASREARGGSTAQTMHLQSDLYKA